MHLKRLYGLDALRGLAALSVVAWHWQHFFALSGVWQQGWRREEQPFFPMLRLLYQSGWAAVDLFFALSGFVFFWLYADAIKARQIGPMRFSLLRFSRLYPLHFATLAGVALLQYFFLRQSGHYFIFDAGSWRRFAAGLVMAQQWLPPTEDQIFNGPAWSVSIEAGLYVLFFAACRTGMAGPRAGLALALLALPLIGWNELIARGITGFFLGGAVFHATLWIKRRADAARLSRLVIMLALAGWALVLCDAYTAILHNAVAAAMQALSPAAARFYDGTSDYFFLVPFILILSPLTIAGLALHEERGGGPYRRLAFLGDISYSTYLLHFPLQLFLALVALRLGWTPQDFMHPLVMIAFFAALIALGAASHYGFERPLQRILRGGIKPRAVAVS